MFGTLNSRQPGIHFFPAPKPDWFGANIGRNSGRAFLPFPDCQKGPAASIPASTPPSPYRNTSSMAHTSAVAILRKCPTISFPNRKHWSKKTNFFSILHVLGLPPWYPPQRGELGEWKEERGSLMNGGAVGFLLPFWWVAEKEILLKREPGK